jgi:crotonobetainyl-CoA:carnitine CoA-transferase CaiB-like acyl-CoA transferase
MTSALEGIRALDLTTVLMKPSATQMLGDRGAGRGFDQKERLCPHSRHVGLVLNLNRGKRSLAIDLKAAPDGRAALLRLAEIVEVLPYNICPASMDRLGLSYEAVAAVNPKVVYVGALGFGRDGHYSNLPAYDDLSRPRPACPGCSTSPAARRRVSCRHRSSIG